MRGVGNDLILNVGSKGYRGHLIVSWYPKLGGKITQETQLRGIHRGLDAL